VWITSLTKLQEFIFALFGFPQVVAEATAAAFTAGAISFLIALGSGFAALLNYRRVMQGFLVGVLAVSIAEIAIGVVIQSSVTGVVNEIFASTASGTTSVPGTSTYNIIHFQLALFNQCCAPNGWSRENAAPGVYPSDEYTYKKPFVDTNALPYYYVPPCLFVNDSSIAQSKSQNWNLVFPNASPSGTQGLLNCYLDQETYRRYNFTAYNNKDLICPVFARTVVDISSLVLKGVNVADLFSQGVLL